jgi:hypothetical protein
MAIEPSEYMPDYTSEELCEALVRKLEVSGSEILEKNFIKDGKMVCTVWLMIGPNTQPFHDMICKWLEKEGFKLD